MNIKTRKITITAILASLCLILGLTPIGYIPIPPVTVTLLCIPVIIGTIMEGLQCGLILGFIFGFTSLMTGLGITLVPNPFGGWLISNYPLQAFITIFVPRLLVPVIVWLVYKAFSNRTENGKYSKIGVGVSAFFGSIANTVFFLGFMYLLMLPNGAQLAKALGTTTDGLFGVISMIGVMNGLPEAALAVIVTVPVIMALKKSRSLKNIQS